MTLLSLLIWLLPFLLPEGLETSSFWVFLFSFLTPSSRDELQEVIEELDVQKRLTLAVSLLKKELEVNRFQMQIQKQLDVSSLLSSPHFLS